VKPSSCVQSKYQNCLIQQKHAALSVLAGLPVGEGTMQVSLSLLLQGALPTLT